MIGIVDVENSNINAVCSAIKRLNIQYQVICRPEDFESNAAISHFILPGVSAYDAYIEALKQSGLFEILKAFKSEKDKKLMGICAGAHALFENSEEGTHDGLGFFKGVVQQFSASHDLQVPHLGWNTISVQTPDAIFSDLDTQKPFYFSHSYHFPATSQALAVCDYGHSFPVVAKQDNVFAVQFHPEKSYNQGLQIIENFCRI